MVPSENYRDVYNGNDATTSFAYGFAITNKAHILVTIKNSLSVESTAVVDVDYTVNGVGNSDSSTWTITYPISGSPLATGSEIILTPNLPIKQLTDFNNQGGFFAKTHEAAFDYLTILAQQFQGLFDRCVKVTVGSSTNPDDLISTLTANAATAATAATTASASATAAASSATTAGTSATSASSSATAAAASAASAVAVGNGILTTKGDIVSYSTTGVRVGVGSNDTSLFADSTATPGVAWKTIDLSTSRVTGNLPVTKLNSGTSASSSTYWRGDGTWAAISSGIFTSSFTSTAQTLTAGGALTLAHGLGTTPKFIFALLQCVTAEKNYSIGDLVPYNLSVAGTGSYGTSYRIDSTNVYVRFDAALIVGDNSTGAEGGITLANWKLIVKAFA